MKRFLIGPLVSFLTIILLFIAAEVAARILLPPQRTVVVEEKRLDPVKGPTASVRGEDGSLTSIGVWGNPHGVRLRPNTSALIINHTLSHRDITITTNSLGLRYKEIGPKAANEFRILFMGDSITFGDYVEEPETISAIVEKQLNASAKNKVITVINGGLPGANASDEYYHYLEIKDAIKPDLVLVGMYLNDANSSQNFYATALKSPYSKSRFLTWLANRFSQLKPYLFADVKTGQIGPEWKTEFLAGRSLKSGDMYHSRDGFDYEIYNAALDFGLAWNPKSWQLMSNMTKTFRDAVFQEGTKFAVLLYPIRMQTLGSVGDVYPQEQFMKMCSNLSIQCLDLLPGLRDEIKETNPKENLYYDHCHMTFAGNVLTADLISKWLQAQLL
jgi:hypothetical protein